MMTNFITSNVANLYQPIEASQPGPAPLVLRVITNAPSTMTVGGAMAHSRANVDYVNVSALPEDLKYRVSLAVQALMQGR
jgi:hypothetical protein